MKAQLREITHKCGHKENHTLTSDFAKNNRIEKRLELDLCGICLKNKIAELRQKIVAKKLESTNAH
jgi:hypothetical protein